MTHSLSWVPMWLCLLVHRVLCYVRKIIFSQIVPCLNVDSSVWSSLAESGWTHFSFLALHRSFPCLPWHPQGPPQILAKAPACSPWPFGLSHCFSEASLPLDHAAVGWPPLLNILTALNLTQVGVAFLLHYLRLSSPRNCWEDSWPDLRLFSLNSCCPCS